MRCPIKTLKDFIATTVMGGLLVVLPLLIFYLLIDQLLETVVVLASPFAAFIPATWTKAINAPLLIAVLLIMIVSFLFGLALRSTRLTRLGAWLESSALKRLPLYSSVKKLSRGLAGDKAEKSYSPALLSHDDGSLELVYVIEEGQNDAATILIPLAPAGFSGPVRIVASYRLTPLDASLGEASQVMSQWGAGLLALADRERRGDR